MTSETVPVAKSAGDLKPGDYVLAADLHPDADGVAEVLLPKKFGSTGREEVMVVISYGDRYQPDSYRLPIGKLVGIASPAAVAEAKAGERRRRLADALHDLADLILNKSLPVPGPYHDMSVRFGFGSNAESVAEVAKALGIETTDRYGQYVAEWPANAEPGELTATWHAYSQKKAEADLKASGLDYTRADTEADDPTPVSPARVPLLTGSVVEGDELVVDDAS